MSQDFCVSGPADNPCRCDVIWLQVYPEGIRHIRADKRVNEWKAPGKKVIVKCAVNQRQVFQAHLSQLSPSPTLSDIPTMGVVRKLRDCSAT